VLIREALIVPNSFQSLHSSQKRASSGRDGFMEITLTDSHLLSFLGQLAPDAESGRHDPSRRSSAPPFIRTSIPCSALGRRAGAIRTLRRNANSCFPPYPAHGPQGAIGKKGDSSNAPPRVTKLHCVKASQKMRKASSPLELRRKFDLRLQDSQKRRNWLGDGAFQSPDQGTQAYEKPSRLESRRRSDYSPATP
jgi:hypothetical protein